MANGTAQTGADSKDSSARAIHDILRRAVLDGCYTRPRPALRCFPHPSLMMAQGEFPNIIDNETFWTNEVFRRIGLHHIGICVDALRSLLEGASPGEGSLQLQSMRKLFSHGRLQGVVSVSAVGLVGGSRRRHPQDRDTQNRVSVGIRGDAGGCAACAGSAHSRQLGDVIGIGNRRSVGGLSADGSWSDLVDTM